MSWDRRSKKVGGAWVLRDSEATVLFHSRRPFAIVATAWKAKLICMKWAMESIHFHGFNRVIFAMENTILVGATTDCLAFFWV